MKVLKRETLHWQKGGRSYVETDVEEGKLPDYLVYKLPHNLTDFSVQAHLKPIMKEEPLGGRLLNLKFREQRKIVIFLPNNNQ